MRINNLKTKIMVCEKREDNGRMEVVVGNQRIEEAEEFGQYYNG